MSEQSRDPLYRTSPSNIPIPDPSLVTVEAIERVKNELRADYSHRIESLKESLTIRLDGIEKAAELLHGNTNRIPTQLERETSRIKDLFDEKFKSLEKQMAEFVSRTESDKVTSRREIDAAFQARKEAASERFAASREAIAKSESANSDKIRDLGMSMTKQLDALALNFQETQKFNISQIGDIKGRLDRGEGTSKGATESRGEHRAEIGSFISIGGFIFSIVSFLIVIVLGIITIPHSPSVPVTVSPSLSPVIPGQSR